jgi:hypothetical protein
VRTWIKTFVRSVWTGTGIPRDLMGLATFISAVAVTSLPLIAQMVLSVHGCPRPRGHDLADTNKRPFECDNQNALNLLESTHHNVN